MKIALDIHGVIDRNPKFFREFMSAIIHADGEIHILTGKHFANGIERELEAYGLVAGIHYTRLFSISDYHREIGTQMWGTIEHPFMEDAIWDRTKADYCRREKIDLCIDDKAEYEKHFLTPFALYKSHTIQLMKQPHADDDGVHPQDIDDFVEQAMEQDKAEVFMEFGDEHNATEA